MFASRTCCRTQRGSMGYTASSMPIKRVWDIGKLCCISGASHSKCSMLPTTRYLKSSLVTRSCVYSIVRSYGVLGVTTTSTTNRILSKCQQSDCNSFASITLQKQNKMIFTGYRFPRKLLQYSPFSNKDFICHFSTTAQNYQKDDPNKKKNNDKDKNQVLLKLGMWMFLMYVTMSVVSLLLPHTDNPDIMRYISWNEFLYHMLAKGEVEQVIIRPELNLVIVVLQDGAVVKGRRMEHKTFHMNVVDSDR